MDIAPQSRCLAGEVLALPPEGSGVPPACVDEVDPATGEVWRFYRTHVEGPGQLTNGKAWIQTFDHVLKNLPRPRRQLGISISDSGDPRFSMPAYGAKQRNEAAKAMREPAVTPGLPEGARRGIGTPLKLPTGDEVLLVCNVGAAAPLELPRKFREMRLEEISVFAVAAKCPHMGGCLNEGELKDVEDIAVPGQRRAIIRCPWHNMQFDLQTGEGIGNGSQLRRYPVRVAHGALYVGTLLADASPALAAGAAGTGGNAQEMDVDMDCAADGAPAPPCGAPTPCTPSRSRSPPRLLRACSTIN